MAEIKVVDRSTCKMLRDEIDSALSVVADRYGIYIKAGSASFSDSSVTFKVECAVKAQDGTVITKEAKAFRSSAVYIGLEPEHLFQEFMYTGKRMQIIGLKPQAHKYPLLVKNIDNGMIYKMHPDMVRHLFK